MRRDPLTVCAPRTGGRVVAFAYHFPQDQQTSNTPQTGALVIGTTSTDGANSLSMSHNVRFHRVLRYRREWTLQSHRRIQISSNVSINGHKQNLLRVSSHTQNHSFHTGFRGLKGLYPGKVALHTRIRHPLPQVMGANRSGSAGEEVNK